jgi:hypothetical protein
MNHAPHTEEITQTDSIDKPKRTVYNRALLDEILLRDGATLIGEYEKLNSEVIINFKCKCGNEHQKKLIQTTISNMLCVVCTKNKKIEKTKKTNLERHGLEYAGPVKKTPLEIFGAELPAICLKYHIEPTPENQEKVKLALQRRIYSYKQRDLDKQQKYITFDDAKLLNNYKIDTHYWGLRGYMDDIELQKLNYLNKKTIAELTSNELSKLCNYVKTTYRPIVLRNNNLGQIPILDKSYYKFVINEIPEFHPLNYNDLVEILFLNSNECSYCKCKMTLLNTQYAEKRLTFDAIIPLIGHRKDNIALCCGLCNSKKGNMKLKGESEDEEEPDNDIIPPPDLTSSAPVSGVMGCPL